MWSSFDILNKLVLLSIYHYQFTTKLKGNTFRFGYAIQVLSSEKAIVITLKRKVSLILIPNRKNY